MSDDEAKALGATHRHYKGSYYKLLGRGYDSEHGEAIVVTFKVTKRNGLNSDKYITWPYKKWIGNVNVDDNKINRFTEL